MLNRFLTELGESAPAYRIKVVPAGGEATYRIRGYLAAHPKGAGASIAWAWDVYDADLHRAFRLSGEETAGARPGVGHADWALTDDAVLRRIARAGLDQLADRMASPANPALEAALAPPRHTTAALEGNRIAAAAPSR
jgi:hypothetical protein